MWASIQGDTRYGAPAWCTRSKMEEMRRDTKRMDTAPRSTDEWYLNRGAIAQTQKTVVSLWLPLTFDKLSPMTEILLSPSVVDHFFKKRMSFGLAVQLVVAQSKMAMNDNVRTLGTFLNTFRHGERPSWDIALKEQKENGMSTRRVHNQQINKPCMRAKKKRLWVSYYSSS